MRKLFVTLLAASCLGSAFITPAFAGNNYEHTLQAPLTTPVKIEVVIGEDLAYRANNLPKDISERRNIRSNSGFSNNGFYGERELDRLAEKLEKRLIQSFAKKDIEVTDFAPTTLRVTIVDAKPNRPTFEQLSREVGLSLQSFGIGGADMEAELISPTGAQIATFSYGRYENDIRDAAFGGTWTDAYRAFGWFARKTADTLSEGGGA